MDVTMPENLSALERKALEQGEWKAVTDPKGGPLIYYNTLTHKTTRDLKGELLKGLDPSQGTPRPGAAGKVGGALSTDDEAKDELTALKEQLASARLLNEQYEHEITQLRHTMMSGGRGSVLDQAICNSAAALAGSNDAAKILAERVRSLEGLNGRLYKQLLLDRETRFVCEQCGHRTVAEEMRGDDNGKQMQLRAAQTTVAESLRPHTLPADTLLARQATDEQLERGRIPEYLPKSFISGSVATSTAPLRIGTTSNIVPSAKIHEKHGDYSVHHDVPAARLRFDMSPPLPIKHPSIFTDMKMPSPHKGIGAAPSPFSSTATTMDVGGSAKPRISAQERLAYMRQEQPPPTRPGPGYDSVATFTPTRQINF